MDFGANKFEESQEKEKAKATMDAVMTPQIGDRVCAMKDGALRKGRIADMDIPEMVGVTFSKHDESTTYFPRRMVYLLYRYQNTPFGEAALILANHTQNRD